MALFRNLGVNLRDCLCDVPMYVSAQSLEFLDLAKKYSFLNWKLTLVPAIQRFIYGWALSNNMLSDFWKRFAWIRKNKPLTQIYVHLQQSP